MAESDLTSNTMPTQSSVTVSSALSSQQGLEIFSIPIESTKSSLTLFPKLPPELRLCTLKILLPGRSLEYIEIWLSSCLPGIQTPRYESSVCLSSHYFMSTASRCESLKRYVVMKPRDATGCFQLAPFPRDSDALSTDYLITDKEPAPHEMLKPLQAPAMSMAYLEALETLPVIFSNKNRYPAGGPQLTDTTPILSSVTKNNCGIMDQTLSAPAPALAPLFLTSASSADLESHAIPTAPDTFTLFPKLPAELRLRVWKEAYPEPRWIEIHSDGIETWSTKCALERSPLFAVCHESRTEVLKSHKFIRGTLQGCIPVPFDGEKDILVFRRDRFISKVYLRTWLNYLEILPCEIADQIRAIIWEDHRLHPVVPPLSPTYLFEADRDVEGFLRMPNLKTVQIAEFNPQQDGCVVVGCVERLASKEYQQKKVELKTEMEALLRGYNGEYVVKENEGKTRKTIEHKVEVTIGKLVLADLKS